LKTSVPGAPGTTIAQVSGEPEHDGLLVVRFAAVSACGPANAVPFTVASVMMTDCVFTEMYCGLRLCACALRAGTASVKRAVELADAAVDEPLLCAPDGSTACETPPPQPASIAVNTSGRTRCIVTFLTEPGRLRW
jgi:hypothetical protein